MMARTQSNGEQKCASLYVPAVENWYPQLWQQALDDILEGEAVRCQPASTAGWPRVAASSAWHTSKAVTETFHK
jgi:hypothetical protein